MDYPKRTQARTRSRRAKPLPNALDKNLGRYEQSAASSVASHEHSNVPTAIAIGAMGLGVLALPQLSEARIIYRPTNQTINQQNRQMKIELNGVAEASFYVGGYCRSGSGDRSCFGYIYANGLQGNQVMLSAQQEFASAAVQGKVIGSKDQFRPVADMARCDSGAFLTQTFHSSKGPWLNVNSRYLGLKFDHDGKTYYGWARLSTKGFPCSPSATLTGYAYETVEDKPIRAGQMSDGAEALNQPSESPGKAARYQDVDLRPGSLGVLALGADGLAVWRKETN